MRIRAAERIGAIAALSIGLHVAVLASLQPASEPLRWRGAPPETVVSLRVIPPISAPDTFENAAPTIKSAQTRPSARAAETPLATAVSASPSLAVWAPFVESDYTSADSLVRRPAPNVDVIVPYPEGYSVDGRIEVVLTLYISELGVVDRIVSEATDFPVLVEAAKAAFRSATFLPGLAHDKTVKSKVRVAVTFDAG